MKSRERREALIEEAKTADKERRGKIAAALAGMRSRGELLGKCLRCGQTQYREDGCVVLPHSQRVVCEPCQPTYAELQKQPELWFNKREVPLTAEEVRLLTDQHLADGGSLSDKPSFGIWYRGTDLNEL